LLSWIQFLEALVKEVSLRFLFFRNVFSRLLGILKNLIVVPFLSPQLLGIYRYILTLMNYSQYLHFGSVTYLIFHYSRLKNNQVQLNSAIQFSVIGLYVGAIASFLLCFFFIPDSISLLESLLISFSSCATLFAFYVLIRLRIELKFNLLAKEDLISQVIGLVFFILLGYIWGVTGLLLGTQLGLLYLIVRYRDYFKISFAGIDVGVLKSKFLIGKSLWFSSLANQLSLSIDLLLLKFILQDRATDYGYYAFCIMIAGIVNSIMGIFIEVQGQIFLEKISQYQHDELKSNPTVTKELLDMMYRDSIISIMIILIVNFGMSIAIFLFLPKYESIIPNIFVFLLSVFILRWRNYFVLILNRIELSNKVTYASIIGVAAAILLMIPLYWIRDLDLKWISHLTLITYLVVNLSVLIIFNYTVDKLNFLQIGIKIVAIFIPCLVLYLYSLKIINFSIYTYFIIAGLSIVLIAPIYVLLIRNDFFGALAYLKAVK
jgi:O-antigen/teichoic acid export membrane protein